MKMRPKWRRPPPVISKRGAEVLAARLSLLGLALLEWLHAKEARRT